jgi:hypothetical protein
LIGSLAILLAVALICVTIRPTITSAQKRAITDGPNISEATASIPQNRQDSILATFNADAPSLGAIPDGPAGCNAYGTNRDVTFTVTGISGTITNVEVNFTLNQAHTWVGDLDVHLIAPGGAPDQVLFSRTGATTATAAGTNSDVGGPFTIKDSAPASPTWWAAAAGAAVLPVGSYRASTPGEVAGGGANTTITPAFAGIGAAANGTWTLRFRDHCAADTGTVAAASLTIAAGPTVIPQHIVDYDGDGKTDPAVVRNTGGGMTGQETFFIQNSSGAPASTTTPWGIATDSLKVPADYDGDGKTDVAVWRAGPPFGSYFYILQSASSTLRSDQFGQSGDDPTVIGDYDGDGKADVAVYRAGGMAGVHSFWYYRSSVNGLILGTEWGQNGDFPAPGDYDGDHKNDYVVQRNNGGGQARFFFNNTTAGQSSTVFGTPTDVIVPGDYDGDGKTDIATVRGSGGQILWNILNSSNASTTSFVFGASATDFPTQGDWDGDGKTDIGVWRFDTGLGTANYYWRRSSDGVNASVQWGANGDYPVANYNAH